MKNLLVFGALLFAGHWNQWASIRASSSVFMGFSFMASTVYIVNDWLDRERDRRHPRKKHRPLASGEISGLQATVMALFLLMMVAASIWALPGSNRVGVAVVFGLYLSLMGGYNLGLKHVFGLDILIVSVGILLRAMAGGFGIGVPVTHWFMVSIFFLSLLLVSGKRRFELKSMKEESPDHRPVLSEYSGRLLDRMITISASAAVVTYSLWTVARKENGLLSHAALPYSIIFVVFGLLRYLYLIYEDQKGGAPERLFLNDTPMMLCVILWASYIVILSLLP